MTDYHPNAVELSAQSDWQKASVFHATEAPDREKFFCFSMMPYPSGELHMGHVRNYVIGDVIARFEKMRGKNVLQPMAWDAFGLPAENAAIKNKLPPSTWTQKNITFMREQMKRLGLAVDWSRELTTCDPNYYQFEQWLFIQLFKKGLAYKKKALVNWDPVDQTVLANEQVIDGKGWRSGVPVERREISQWFLKITDYAEALLEDLSLLEEGWSKQVIEMQRNWIGKSEGVEITFSLNAAFLPADEKVTIYTTRADTLMGVTYLAIAFEHPLVIAATKKNPELKKFIEAHKQSCVSEADIATQEKVGMDTGISAVHPITQEKIPVWVTNFVLMEYGSGAVMAVPAHDVRAHAFSKKYHLPIKIVLQAAEWNFEQAAFTDFSTLINSSEFNGLTSQQAIQKIGEKYGVRRVHYRLRDWGISRQRYWGAPIPMVHCAHCGDVPVDENDLPILLPTDLIPTGHGSPLAESEAFYKTFCPRCKKPAKRETDTMDTFMESSWYFARYCSFDQKKTILDARVNYWMPVDYYIGGIEHAILHLLYARFIHKVLRDLGFIKTKEPFKKLLTQGMVLKDGAKMSKSKGNIVAPLPLIEKYGVDTLRLFAIFAAPPEQSLEWSDSGVEGSFRFLKKLWKFAMALTPENITKQQNATPAFSREIHTILQQIHTDMARTQFNTVVSGAMKLLNALQETKDEATRISGCSLLLRILSPIVPHITHVLWKTLEFGDMLATAAWPTLTAQSSNSEPYELMIQINGKLRGKVSVMPDEDEAAIKAKALAVDNIKVHLADKEIVRVIIVPRRLINIVVK